MAMYIVGDECITCGDCEPECPEGAIYEGKIVYHIDSDKCTECEGHYDNPRCVEVCPIDDCILPLSA